MVISAKHSHIAALVAIGLALALIAWWYVRSKKVVLDASNSAYANGMFDALNPGIAGVGTTGPGTAGASS